MSARTPKLPGTPDLDAACLATHGQPWSELKKPLTPHYGKAWAGIGLCYLGLATGTGGVALAQLAFGWNMALALVPIGALITGFWMASLVRFMHEGGHHLLHPDRRWNDRLCNLFVTAWVLDEVDNNRKVHWQHHLNLGGHGDTEISYYRAPTNGFLFRTLTALYVFDVVGRRILSSPRESTRTRGRTVLVIGRSIAYHLVLLGLFLSSGLWVGALCWVVAMGSTYPFFDVLRQVLEHRRVDIGPAVDLSVDVHGPLNRLFAKHPVSRWFGNAGFHNHLLHHWDPTVSYTRLDEMEEVLLPTALGDEIRAARTTYWHTWKQLRAALQA